MTLYFYGFQLDVLKSGGKTEDETVQENGSIDNVDGSSSQQPTMKVIFILFLSNTYEYQIIIFCIDKTVDMHYKLKKCGLFSHNDSICQIIL